MSLDRSATIATADLPRSCRVRAGGGHQEIGCAQLGLILRDLFEAGHGIAILWQASRPVLRFLGCDPADAYVCHSLHESPPSPLPKNPAHRSEIAGCGG